MGKYRVFYIYEPTGKEMFFVGKEGCLPDIKNHKQLHLTEAKALAEKDALIQEAIEALENSNAALRVFGNKDSGTSGAIAVGNTLKETAKTLQKLRESKDDRSEK